jgi:Fic family protein
MLFRDPRLGDAEKAVLDQIRQLWTDLRHNLRQRPRKWTGLLARNLRARAIQGSNSIEGHHVGDEAALAALEGDRPEDTDENDWINVVHYREAMDYVLQLAADARFAYGPQLLRSLHFIMMRHRADRHPGLWRPGAIYVRNDASGDVVYEGPPAAELEALATELCDKLTARDADSPTRLVRAAMAHLNLVMIHPFSDGNGRMARSLQTLVLARGGVLDSTLSSIEEYLGRNTPAYYRVLAEVGQGSWHPRNDALPWLRFCLRAHHDQAARVRRRIDRIARLSDEVERELSRHGLPDRAAVSLVNAAQGYRIRNESYRREADVSVAVASRDLRQLTEAALIVAAGEKRGRHYAAGPWLRQLAETFHDRRPIPDPFAGK